MKKFIISFILAFAISTFICDIANAQCKQQFVYNCTTTSNGVYLKDFNAKIRSDQKETKWTIVLDKNSKYEFRICTPENAKNDIVFTLHDSQETPCGISENGESFEFVCEKTGMYYISIKLDEDSNIKKTCAVGILSFINYVD